MATKFYLYRHIRKDKNEPFYIGIGSKREYFTSPETEFSRAFCVKQRNQVWHRIYSKCNKDITIEILFESDCRSLILKKEQEFINLYRLKKEGGTLSNLSYGGETSNLGYRHTEETKLKIAEAGRRRKGTPILFSEDTLNRLRERSYRPVIVEKNGIVQEFKSVKDGREFMGTSIGHISELISTGKVNRKGFCIKYKE